MIYLQVIIVLDVLNLLTGVIIFFVLVVKVSIKMLKVAFLSIFIKLA